MTTPSQRRRPHATGLVVVAIALTTLLASALSLPSARAFDAVTVPDDEDLPDEHEYPAESIVETTDEIRVPFQGRKQILSLGGNGMIGTAVLSELIARDEYDITLVSRGSWPFDSAELIKPHVNFIECDRSDRPPCPEEDEDPIGWEECDDNAWRHACPELVKAVGASDDYWAVLDFSGYRGEWVQDAIDELGDMVRVYVYVSTDSVYEVSVGVEEDRGTGKRSTEDMAVRPDDVEEAYRLAVADSYGHHKLQGEEVLQWQREEEVELYEGDDDDETWNGFPYVALRFADVVGPRDNTGRYATYHVWSKYVGRVEGIPPFHIQEDVVEATSITYVEDAAQAILKAMDDPDSWDEAYNIGSEEVFNATEMLPMLGQILGRYPALLDVKKLPDDESFSVFPSITRGPMDMTKAKDRLGFAPTPVRTVLERTAGWYEEMFLRSEAMREGMVEEFVEHVLDEDDDDIVTRLWEAIDEDVKEERERRWSGRETAGEEL